MKERPQTIGERIAARRAAVGMKPAELARRIGVKPQAIYMLESGVTKAPTPENLFKIADELRTDARALVFGGEQLAAMEPPADYRLDELFDEETLRFARRFAGLNQDQRRSWMLSLLLNGRHAPDERVAQAYGAPTKKKKP